MRTVAGSGRLLKSNSTDELTIIDVGLRYALTTVLHYHLV